MKPLFGGLRADRDRKDLAHMVFGLFRGTVRLHELEIYVMNIDCPAMPTKKRREIIRNLAIFDQQKGLSQSHVLFSKWNGPSNYVEKEDCECFPLKDVRWLTSWKKRPMLVDYSRN